MEGEVKACQTPGICSVGNSKFSTFGEHTVFGKMEGLSIFMPAWEHAFHITAQPKYLARCSSLSRYSRVHRNSLYPFGYSAWSGVARHPRSAGTDPLKSIYLAHGVPQSSRQGHRHRGGPHKSSTSSRGHRVVSCLIMLLLLIMHTSDRLVLCVRYPEYLT